MDNQELKKCDACQKMTEDIREYQERYYAGGKMPVDGYLWHLCKDCYKTFRKVDKKWKRKVLKYLLIFLAILVLVGVGAYFTLN